MNLRELNSGTPSTKQWLKPVFGQCDIGETTYEYTDTPTVLPDAGSSKLYIKNDGKVYTIDSAGTERIIEDSTGDLTDLENKTQNIDLAGTVANTTQLNGDLTMASGNIRMTDTRDLIFGNGGTFISALTNGINDPRVRLQNATTRPVFEVCQPNAPDTTAVPCSVLRLNKNTGGLGAVNLEYYHNGTDVSVPNAGGRLNHLCFSMTGSPCEFEFFEDQSMRAGNLHYDQGDKAGANNNGLKILDTTASTSTTTGAIQCSGGVGIAENLQVGSNIYVNGSPVSTGAYSTITSTTVAFNTVGNARTGLIAPTGIGNPVIIPNKLRAGGHYCLKAAGTITCAQNTDLTFFIVLGNPLAGPSTAFDQATLPVLSIGPCTNKPWQLDGYITVRTVGGAGVASNVGRIEFRTNENNQNAFFGDSALRIENTNFDTTDLNIFDLQFQWATSNPGDEITCDMFVGSTLFQP